MRLLLLSLLAIQLCFLLAAVEASPTPAGWKDKFKLKIPFKKGSSSRGTNVVREDSESEASTQEGSVASGQHSRRVSFDLPIPESHSRRVSFDLEHEEDYYKEQIRLQGLHLGDGNNAGASSSHYNDAGASSSHHNAAGASSSHHSEGGGSGSHHSSHYSDSSGYAHDFAGYHSDSSGAVAHSPEHHHQVQPLYNFDPPPQQVVQQPPGPMQWGNFNFPVDSDGYLRYHYSPERFSTSTSPRKSSDSSTSKYTEGRVSPTRTFEVTLDGRVVPSRLYAFDQAAVAHQHPNTQARRANVDERWHREQIRFEEGLPHYEDPRRLKYEGEITTMPDLEPDFYSHPPSPGRPW